MNNLKKINGFLNNMWKFIKSHEIPTQNDDEAWDKVIDDATELTADHQSSDPIDKLFRMWVVAYLEYMSTVSKGMPTLMQEAHDAQDEVMRAAG